MVTLRKMLEAVGFASLTGGLAALGGYWSDPSHVNLSAEGLKAAATIFIGGGMGSLMAYLRTPPRDAERRDRWSDGEDRGDHGDHGDRGR